MVHIYTLCIEIKFDIKINTLHSHFNIMHTYKYAFAQTHYNIFTHAHRSTTDLYDTHNYDWCQLHTYLNIQFHVWNTWISECHKYWIVEKNINRKLENNLLISKQKNDNG